MARGVAAAVAFILLGFGFRVWGGAHAQLNFDQAWFWSIALDLVQFKQAPGYGSLISGSDARVPSPLFHYLTALPHVISEHPRAGSTFFSLLHALAGFGLFWIARRIATLRMAVIIVALFALVPWDVLYGDSIWLSNIAPVYGVALAAAAVAAQTSARGQGLLVALLFAGPALHLSLPIAWVAAAVMVIWARPQKLDRKAIVIGAAVGVAFFVPSLIMELINDWANTRAIFNKAMGTPPPDGALRSSAQVPVYAVLFGSSEIGYFFERGYWGGGFDSLKAYLSLGGWQVRLRTMHPVAACITVVSVVMALAGWVFALAATGRQLLAALRARDAERRPAISGQAAVTCAVVATLFASFVLLLAGKKIFFPHYITVVAPLCLWPLAWGLDRLAQRRRMMPVVAALVLISMASMATNTVRYYGQIESLNGLNTTLGIARWLAEEEGAFQLHFNHFDNEWAVRAVAARHFDRELNIDAGASVSFVVHNEHAHIAAPKGKVTRRFGLAGVLVERNERAQARSSSGVFNARQNWSQGELRLQQSGRSRGCTPDGELCRYGPNPWEHHGPEIMSMNGWQEPVLFIHPLERSKLIVNYEIPAGPRYGLLHYGLSDAACRSGNRSPVRLRLKQGSHLLLTAQTDNNRPGLHSVPFVLTSTTVQTISVELTTDHQGDRVVGYDIDLYDQPPKAQVDENTKG